MTVPVRYLALEGLVNVLKTVTPAGGYVYDLSATDVVEIGVDTIGMMLERSMQVQVQVREGREDHTILYATPHAPRNADYQIVIFSLLKGDFDTPTPKRLNQLLADINKVIGLNPTLQNTVHMSHLARVVEPVYDSDRRAAWASIELVTNYQYEAGVSI